MNVKFALRFLFILFNYQYLLFSIGLDIWGRNFLWWYLCRRLVCVFDVSRLQFPQPQDSWGDSPPFHASHFSFLLLWFPKYSCCIAKTVARCPPIYLMCFVVMETHSKVGTHPVQLCYVPRRPLLRPSDNNKVRKSQSLQIGIRRPTINQRH